MKKIFYILIAGLLSVSVGCSVQNDSISEPTGDMIRFGASQIGSKVDFNTDPADALNITWAEGDEVGISATKNGELFGCNYLYNINELSAEATSANLAASSNLYAYRWAEEGNYTFYAYYPYTGVQGSGVHYLTTVSLPAVQNQQCADDYSHLKDMWTMKSEPYTISGAQNTVQLSFEGVYSIVELKLKYAAATTAPRAVERVQLNSSVAPLVAENMSLMLDTDDTTGDLVINEGKNSVDVMLSQPFELSTEQTQSVWLLVVPGEHKAGEIGVQLQTVNSYRLDLTIPEAVTFEPNKVYRKEVVVDAEDFYYWKDPNAPAVTYFKPITALEDITDGEYIIGFDFKDESVGDMWLKLAGATRNPIAASYDEAQVEPYAELGILSVAQGFVWTLKKNGEGFNISTKDKDDTEWLLNGCNKAQGISMATTVTGHYVKDETYSNLWYIYTQETGEFYIQNETSSKRYLVVDTVNNNEWRNGGVSPVEQGTFVFYKKVTE